MLSSQGELETVDGNTIMPFSCLFTSPLYVCFPLMNHLRGCVCIACVSVAGQVLKMGIQRSGHSCVRL